MSKKWQVIPRAYFEDYEEPDCILYVFAKCPSCGRDWHNRQSIFHSRYGPEEYNYDHLPDVDKIVQEDFIDHPARHVLPPYCEHCGEHLVGLELGKEEY